MPTYVITITGHSVNEIFDDSTELAQAILDDTFVVTDFHAELDEEPNV